MANSQLQGKRYLVPSEVLQSIESALVKYPNVDGVKRAKNIIHKPDLSYEEMKRLKNYFDTANPETDGIRYALTGGNGMREFIETSLAQDRAGVQRSKETKRDMTSNPNSELMPYQASAPRLSESKRELKKNVVAVIVNEDNKILLLKRSDFKDQWMPNKWALIGGGIEKGESPEEACEREIQEETGLEIKKFTKSFTIQRHADSQETVLACRYTGEPTDITLNEENSNYGWYDVSEMEYLDIVPHLIEYITLVFKKYE